MIAIFNTEKESVNYSKYIHDFLLKNRKNYFAEKWSDINKSANEEKWCVKLPTDYIELGLDIEGLILVENLPKNWINVV